MSAASAANPSPACDPTPEDSVPETALTSKARVQSAEPKALSLKGGIPETITPSCADDFLKLLRELREAYLAAYYKLVY